MTTALSLIIITKNRPQQLVTCLQSVHKSSYKNFELIVVDQSTGQGTAQKNPQLLTALQKFPQVKYIQSKLSGKSRGLNLAIKLSSAPILAFTDDDCIVDEEWLQNVASSFREHPHVTAVFGRTLPFQPHKNKGLTCPATFTKKTPHFVTEPCKHWKHIGFGNNMAWRKEFFKQHGLFKEWLGPGSIGSNAEDAEIALRALVNKKKIFYNPAILVKHNKWLNEKGLRKLNLSYICGEMACYGHLAENNISIGKTVVKNNWENIKYEMRRIKDASQLIKLVTKTIYLIRGWSLSYIMK